MNYEDTLWILLREYRKGMNISNNSLSEILRRTYDNKFPTPTSPKMKEMYGLDEIPKFNSRPRGVYLEHIIAVRDRITILKKMAKENPNLTKEDVSEYVKSSYKAVYKIKKFEPLTESKAEIYLTK
jgi:nicotinic acid mononucleotide adenylyltransferase